jgi:hypothetical protein
VNRLVVVTANKVFVYLFSLNPQKLHTFETIDNPNGKKVSRMNMRINVVGG